MSMTNTDENSTEETCMKARVITTAAIVVILAALAAGEVLAGGSPTPPTQPTSKQLTPEQLAARRAVSRANWEALPREEKAARKGHKIIPHPPARPAMPDK
jgi:hypothetical protein